MFKRSLKSIFAHTHLPECLIKAFSVNFLKKIRLVNAALQSYGAGLRKMLKSTAKSTKTI